MESIDVGFWSVLPPLIAIALALITKQVIFSLIIGVLSGAVIYTVASGLGFVSVFQITSEMMVGQIEGKAAFVIFTMLLGALVGVIVLAGGSRAYGNWAAKALKTKAAAGAATGILGTLIFIDDYFNCLTVGTVMRPVTDKFKISREKLAYIVDATAAPICIIAPVSSWAASVILYMEDAGISAAGLTGMEAFIQSIPWNLYALLTLFMVFWITMRKKGDFGPMAAAQKQAEEAQASGEGSEAEMNYEGLKVSAKGTVWDMIIPIIALVVISILAMLMYGGLWDGSGMSVFEAFGNTDATLSLALSTFCSLIIAFILFVPRKLLSFKEFFVGVDKGLRNMVPAMVILTLAWTLCAICSDLLGTGAYLATLVHADSLFVSFIPAILFLIACGISFATGTSWGTFGMLIPIATAVCIPIAATAGNTNLLTVTLAAVLGGSVFGDHCSPISDTTILSSTGADCDHLRHVATQIPYAITVAAVCVVGYIIAGLTSRMAFGVSLAISAVVSFALLIVLLVLLPKTVKKEQQAKIEA